MTVDHQNGVTFRFKCDECGQFIPFDDILSTAAIHRLVTEDTLFSSESYETLCKDCNQ